jgi:class 3 adenylate cyclase/pimeloyl-ACP methyl ester carboxylesterase
VEVTEQEIRFCTTSDGVRIAYTTMGEGSPPLVFVPTWISSLKYTEYEPAMASYIAAHRRLVLFDVRGTGISDRDVQDFSRSALIRDVEAVIDHLKLRRVALWGMDDSGPTAIEYVHRHPDRVSHLVLLGCAARGRDVRVDDTDALIQLLRKGWDVAPEMWASLTMPGVKPATARAFFTAIRESGSGESAAAQHEARIDDDVTDLLGEIKTPTLVLHARGDPLYPFELGRQLAALLPNARLVPLDWEIHWDPENYAQVVDAVEQIIAPAGAGREKLDGGEPSAFHTILFTDIEGSTALAERLGDAKAQELRRAHDTIVREALKGCSGTETKHTGDGIMASFPSASRAIECAVSVQRAIAERGDATLRVRIGLNAGEPVAEEADLFGTAVNLARRICDRAEQGQILVSDVVHQLAAGKGFTFADNGEAKLKGFEKPVRLHEVRWRDD